MCPGGCFIGRLVFICLLNPILRREVTVRDMQYIKNSQFSVAELLAEVTFLLFLQLICSFLVEKVELLILGAHSYVLWHGKLHLINLILCSLRPEKDASCFASPFL